MLRIEPVRPEDRARALALVSGDVGGASGHRRAANLERLLAGQQADRFRLWWARSLRGPRAAAMTVRYPGRTAMVFFGPAGGGQPLARLLAGLTDATLADGVAFVQAMLPAGDRTDARAVLLAGYVFLAELIYLRREPRPAPAAAAGEFQWQRFKEGDEPRLGRIIEETYEGSRDCPGLRGLRRMEDVIAGHKSSGVFRPESWWMPTWQDEAVGCVLVNDAAEEPGAAEVVYLGVRPACRRRGFGTAMLRKAIADAWRRGRGHVNIAVDAANTPALRLYQREGFEETDRRDVYIKPFARAGGQESPLEGRADSQR